MDKNEFIEYIHRKKLIERWGNKQLRCIAPNIREDVIQEVYLLLLEIDDDRYQQIASQGFKKLTAFTRQFVINSLSPNGRTRDLIKLFQNECSMEDCCLDENNPNENDYEE